MIETQRFPSLTQDEEDDGDFETEYKKGLLYLHGIGVEKSYENAYKWLKLSADKGYCRAILSMAFMYLDGIGVFQNAPKAYSRFKFVADEEEENGGDTRAQLLLGLMFEHGVGVEQNDDKALEYYQRAGDKEHEEHLLFLIEIMASDEEEDDDND